MTVVVRLCAVVLFAGLHLIPIPASAADGSVLDRIRDTGEITLGVRSDAQPHSYLSASGDPAGYTVDVCREVVTRLQAQLGMAQLSIRYEVVDATDRFQAVAEGRVDLLCGAATITLGRRELVDFTIPTFADGASILTWKDVIENFNDLDGKRIGVRAGTTTERLLRASVASFGMVSEVVPVQDHAEGLHAVETGAIAAYFGDQSILYALRNSSPMHDQLAVSQKTLTLELHGLALRLDDHRFRLALDRAISQLYREGRMVDLFESSFPDAEPGDLIRYIHTFAPVPQ